MALRIVNEGGKTLAFGIGQCNDVVGHDGAVAFSRQVIDISQRTLPVVIVTHAPLLISLREGQWGVRLTGIDARLVVHNPRFSKGKTREDFHVEAHLSYIFIRNGTVQIDGHFQIIPHTLHLHLIAELKVGIDHRVETCQVTAGVGVLQGGGNIVGSGLTLQLFGQRLPLSGGGLQTDVAIRHQALSVHQDAYTCLMALGIDIIESHHIHSIRIEIASVIELECLGVDGHSACNESTANNEFSEMVHSGWIIGYRTGSRYSQMRSM